MSVTNHNSALCNLYEGINNTFTELNQKFGELPKNHNTVAKRLVHMEELLEPFLVDYFN